MRAWTLCVHGPIQRNRVCRVCTWTVRVAQRSVVQYLRVIRSQQEALSRLWTRVDNDRVLVAARMRHNEAIKKSEEVDALMRASNAGGSAPQREPIASRRKCVAVWCAYPRAGAP